MHKSRRARPTAGGLGAAVVFLVTACSGPWVQISAATPVGDGADLKVTLAYCAVGRGEPVVRVVESASEVLVFVDVRDPGEGKACASVVDVHLSEPLGHRTLRDGHNRRTIPVGADVSLTAGDRPRVTSAQVQCSSPRSTSPLHRQRMPSTSRSSPRSPRKPPCTSLPADAGGQTARARCATSSWSPTISRFPGCGSNDESSVRAP